MENRPLGHGYPVQPQNWRPECLPAFAVRRAMALPHRGQRTPGKGIRRIRPIGWIRLGAASTLGKTGGGQLLAVATSLDEGFFQRGQLLIQEVVGLVDDPVPRINLGL